jgi:serine/threonine protein kinase
MSTPGWRIPGYVADELIGFGAVGEVWRGRDLVSGEVVALKRLRVPDDDGHARLRREAALLAALDHPHLLRLRDTVRTDDRWVLVLDYAAGSSLASLLLDRGRLRPGEVVTALSPLAAALGRVVAGGLVGSGRDR